MRTFLNIKTTISFTFFVCSMMLASPSVAQNTITDCYKTAGGVACNQRAPNNFDAINQLVGVLQSIKDDAAKKQAADDEAERLAAESARRDELVAIERQNAETERSRVEAIAQQQANAQQEREAARQAEQELRTQVSTAVLGGRCEDAKTIALLASRIDMAEQAMRLCKPKVPAKKSKNSKARTDSGPTTKPFLAQSGPVNAPPPSASQQASMPTEKLEATVLKTVAVQQNGEPIAGIALNRSTISPGSAKVDFDKFQLENLPQPPQQAYDGAGSFVTSTLVSMWYRGILWGELLPF